MLKLRPMLIMRNGLHLMNQLVQLKFKTVNGVKVTMSQIRIDSLDGIGATAMTMVATTRTTIDKGLAAIIMVAIEFE